MILLPPWLRHRLTIGVTIYSQMDRKKTILYFAPNLASFNRNDVEILSTEYSVKTKIRNWKGGPKALLSAIEQLAFLLFNLRKTKAVVISFGGPWAYLPVRISRLFKVPVYIILNGTDCAAHPSLKYGSLRSRNSLVGKTYRYAYQKASLLLPVSQSLVETTNSYSMQGSPEEAKQGYLTFFPNIETPYQVLFNGVKPEFWKPASLSSQERQGRNTNFVAVFSLGQFQLKGGDLIIQMARRFPNCNFSIVGCNQPDFVIDAPKNLSFLGKQSPQQLLKTYQNSQFHFQLSQFEGFGVALCEAMLCECVPIGSSVNMIPEIIGETGFVLNNKNPDELESLIRKAISSKGLNQLGERARVRVLENYSFEQRKAKFLEIVKNENHAS